MAEDGHTIDLRDRIEEIDDMLAERRDELENIEAEARALDPEGTAPVDDSEGAPTEAERFEELAEEYDDLQERVDTLERAKSTIEETIENWGGSELTFKELTWGDVGRIQDEVRAQALRDRRDDFEANLSAYKIKTVEVAVTSIPPVAPDSAAHWPPAVGEYVFERIEALNSRGEGEEGNSERSSLRQAITEPATSEEASASADSPPS